MRPSRIVVGEVRQEESLDLLIALDSGPPSRDFFACLPGPSRAFKRPLGAFPVPPGGDVSAADFT